MRIDVKGKYVEWEMARFQLSQLLSTEKGQAKGDYLSNRDRWERKKWGIIGGCDGGLRGIMGECREKGRKEKNFVEECFKSSVKAFTVLSNRGWVCRKTAVKCLSMSNLIASS